MKFINEHGKLLGLINPIDLVVVIILVVLGMKVFSDYRPAPLEFKTRAVTIGLLVKNVPSYLANSVLVGQDVFQDGTSAYLGKIQTVQALAAEILLTQNGTILQVKSPCNLDLRLQLKRRAKIIKGPARSGVYLGKLAVRVGDHLAAHTLYTSMAGEIEYLKVQIHGR